ncbi:Putative sterile alpha motif domain, High mobility group box domain-containing protein [Colletotrichum destructivum]|uniref:Sterile alpha motif domain, High mobility group box domain-containing protein n=1 Tax=Colletotrichum destructivum TaxID=34406 RepID=A0AAX4HYT7_9PEZI|nr:Putative sterile alpha motif domain, High mobility group box domain-containing protein [Colletotrichum destructivum]
MAQLESIFAELGIMQYVGIFLEHGFDTWETIMDIAESDLYTLGVKLGHRRKLQRRIASSRGLAPGASLVASSRVTAEGPRIEAQRPVSARSEVKIGPAVTKRKYRRHPKSDDNAPERPPSAYVLFSSKVRDETKNRNLTFTEIAKLVGENWQNLSPVEKEPYETKGSRAREKYNHDLTEYKKTAKYRQYNEYLRKFKAKQASADQAKESSKRQKLESGNCLQNKSAGATSHSLRSTGSSTKSQPGCESSLNWKQQTCSVVSVSKLQYTTAVATAILHHNPTNASTHLPTRAQFDQETLHLMSPLDSHNLEHRPAWTGSQATPEVFRMHFPPVSGISSNSNGWGSMGIPRSPETKRVGVITPPQHPDASTSSPLKHEYPYTGSAASSDSGTSNPRTPSTSSLPIQAWVFNEMPSASAFKLQTSSFPKSPTLQGQFAATLEDSREIMNGRCSPSPALFRFESSSSTRSVGSLASSHSSLHVSSQTSVGTQDRSDPKLNGLSALVRASEIVKQTT